MYSVLPSQPSQVTSCQLMEKSKLENEIAKCQEKMNYLTQTKTNLVVKIMLLHDDTKENRVKLTTVNAEIYMRGKEIEEWRKAQRNIEELFRVSQEQ